MAKINQKRDHHQQTHEQQTARRTRNFINEHLRRLIKPCRSNSSSA